MSFNLDISPLPSEFLNLIRAKFTGYIAVHKIDFGVAQSYYLWLQQGEFVGAYPLEFDLLQKLVDLKELSSGKAKTIRSAKKPDEPIYKLMKRLDLQLDTPTDKLLSIIFEEQCNLGKEIFATTSGKASIFPVESESELPQDNLTGYTMPGIKFFIQAMRNGQEEIAKSYKSLIPDSIYSLRRQPNRINGEEMAEALNLEEKAILQFADGVMSIKQIARQCNLRTRDVKLIFIRLNLLGLIDTDISPNLQDKVMARAGYQRIASTKLNIQANNNKALTGAGLLGITLLILNLAGLFQPAELSFFDRFSRWRKLSPSKDITVVSFSDEDIKEIGQWPMSDAYLHQVLNNLSELKPVSIGLDIVRDIPNPPGTDKLEQYYRQNDSAVFIQKYTIPVTNAPEIPAKKGNVASSDLLLDPDTLIRRNLITLWDGEKRVNSLGAEMASRYLVKSGIEMEELRGGGARIGEAELKPLSWWNSGYRWVDLGGVQMLSNYTGEDFTEVSLIDVYKNKIDPALIQDKVVLIGSKADSLKDLFNTPISKKTWGNQPTPGVTIHANVASSLIQGARGEIDLLKPLNLPSEIGLIGITFILGMGGGMAVLWYQFNDFSAPSWLITAGIAGGLIIVIVGGGFWLFTGGTWIPVFTMSLASMAGLFYSSAQFQEFSKKLLYTDRNTGIKNRKYLMQHLDNKHIQDSNYSLVGIYFNLSELKLDQETKNSTLKEIYQALNKFVQADCEIVQLSINCLIISLDVLAKGKIEEVKAQIDKTLRGLNITDDEDALEFRIADINNVVIEAAKPEDTLKELSQKLGNS